MLNGPSPVEGSVSPPAASGLSVMTLMERICRLEEQHQHDRKLWEDELKEERRARREDARVLREAMYSFYKFMEREVPGKFVAVDDKIDGLLDSVSRLEERIGVIDDSTMALENRVADLEAGGDGDAEDENGQLSGNNVEGEESNHNRPKREISADHAQPVRGTITSPRSNGASQPRTRSPVASMAPPAHPVNPRSVSPCPSTNLISHSPKATDENSAFPLELLEAPAPITGAHTYVNTLSSPSQDFVPPVLPRRDSVTGKPLFHATSPSHDVPLIKPPLPPSSSSTSRIDHTISTSQHLPPATCPTTIEDSAGPYCELPSPLTRKRKFDVDGRETGPRQQRPMFIPMPPPLSLSGSNLKA
ncbi:hypothetical protein FQN53_002715 [Emmonsiellopsis sp. PD_33]|nr:hypothetical protein FQN53_002715 [Emmonsiellopsis sp. PD_33]